MSGASTGRFSWVQWLAAATALLVLSFAGACAHSSMPKGEDSSSGANQHQLPFHETGSGQAGNSDVSQQGSITPGGDNATPPFSATSSGILPAGTLLAVRLEDSISSAKLDTKSDADASFTAALEDPVVVMGNTVVARGMLVRGRVESAQASAIQGNKGYARLTLLSLHIDGRDVRLQTSSLFIRGKSVVPATPVKAAFSPTSSMTSGGYVQIQKGRILTFRLSSPASVPAIDSADLSKNSSHRSD